jgi:hypothetical protein
MTASARRNGQARVLIHINWQYWNASDSSLTAERRRSAQAR